MATNDYLPFATGAGANVLDQAAYAALAARLTGFQAGVAKSNQANKAIRQGAFMASVLAQFIADTTGQDVLDDGDAEALLDKLVAAILGGTPGRLLNIQVFDLAGSFTYTPTPGAKWAIGDVQAAGGQGGGSPAAGSGNVSFGTGGHSGARIVGKFSLIGVTSLPVTVGTGGSTAAAGAAGQGGGSSSVGSLLTAAGGSGGGALGPTPGPSVFGNPNPLPNVSADPSVQVLIAQRGNAGSPGIIVSAGGGISGSGGVSPGYSGSVTGSNGTGAGAAAAQPGQGGSGAFTAATGSAQIGGAGGRGRILFWEYA